MLEYLRNASEKPIAKVLITILAFSFIGWGVAEWVFGGAVSDSTLVRVGGSKISATQFSNAKSQELAGMDREEQRAVYTDPAQMQKLTEKILQDLATKEMAGLRARDMGLRVSDHKIAAEIREMPEFQQAGEFSEKTFDAVLANAGLSETSFAATLREQDLREMVLAPVAAELAVPDFVVQAAYNTRYAMRNIEYSTVRFDDFNIEDPSTEQLRSFYASNPHTVAETRFVSYVLVPTKMDQPDEYDAGFATAQKVEDSIISGESLADAATKHDVKFVDVGELKADSAAFDDVMDASMISRMFHMDEGTESELIETKSGFVIARVDRIVAAHNAEFDDVRDSLIADWKRAEQKKQAYVKANAILVDVKGGADMPDKQDANVTRASGAPIEVLGAAFNKDVNSKSLVEAQNAFYVLHVVSEKTPDVDSEKMGELKTELQKMSAHEITDDYNAFLKRQYPVKVNEKVYNRYFAK